MIRKVNCKTEHTVAIMQPTYLPWIGYFDLLDQADTFVFLDSVQFDKRSWQQRNRIKTHNGESFLTVPVMTKGRRNQKISEVEIARTQDFPKKHLRTIEHNYSKAEHFAYYWDELNSLLKQDYRYLAELNITLIKWFKRILGIHAELIRSSMLDVKGKRVELLVEICKSVGAKRYLSPIGSRPYIENNNLFEKQDIDLRYQNYSHPEYRQLFKEFIPYMSIPDLLFNEGKKSLEILRSGRKENIISK